MSLLLAGAAAAQEPPPRESALVVYGDDPCPQSTGDDDVVVCARRPEEERYRIPPRLRERRDRPAEISWGARSEDLEQAQRETRPGSCTVVGSGGQTGCTREMIRQWFAERRQRRRD